MEMKKSFQPRNAADWRRWLEKYHTRETEVWLVYLRPTRGSTNLDYETSVEEALCFGWIDSIIQKIDDQTYARKFNPRRLESQWSETNKRRVLKVIRERRMTAAGLAKVTFELNELELEGPKPKRPAAVMPERVKQALRANPRVWEAFQRVAPSLQRTYILWLADAKKPETFERRLRRATEELLAGKPTAMH